MNDVPRVDWAWPEIRDWRKAQRAQWIAWRRALLPQRHRAWGGRIAALLCAVIPVSPQTVIGFCWPFQAEVDPRFAVRRWRQRGAQVALPEVTGKGQPLQFRLWWPGVATVRGVFDIPVPAGTDMVVPDIVIVPMNAFDERGFRLGYGGGYFDRTLAALEQRVIAVGVCHEGCRLPSIGPQAHDLPMDLVVTEAGIYAAGAERLRAVGPAEGLVHVLALQKQRRLPRARMAQGRYARFTDEDLEQ